MSEITKFEDMGLSANILSAIEEMGFVEPSPIQAVAIPAMMTGKDIIGQAQTGTGKTAAFGIPIIERLDLTKRATQAIVLTPTRELAIQVAEEINKLAKQYKGLSVVPIYGGQAIDRQIRALRSGVQVVIGTPGRVIDHINRKTMKLDQVKIAVLDEADEMLDMGFLDDIKEILKAMPVEGRQTVLFSATMPDPILGLAKKFQKDPQHIKVVHKELTVPKVKQIYYEVRENEKAELLTRLVDYHNPNLAIVFVKTKMGVEDLKEKVHAAGYSVEGLHGDMKQTQRDFVMKRFRNNDFDILIATDVAARGIDVDDIDIVFNYDLPQDEEYYVHRIGRTARAGREGVAISFITMREFRKLKDIERFIKTKIERKPIPSLKDVESVRNEAFISNVVATIESGDLDKYITMISESLSGFSSLEVAAALMKMMMGADEEEDSLSRPETREVSSDGYVRYFVTIGKKDGIGVADLLKFIHATTGLNGRVIGDIAFLEKFSFVNVPTSAATTFMDAMSAARFNNRRIHVEVANQRKY